MTSLNDSLCDRHSIEIFFVDDDGLGYDGVAYDPPLAKGYYYAATENGSLVSAPVGPFALRKPAVQAMYNDFMSGDWQG